MTRNLTARLVLAALAAGPLAGSLCAQCAMCYQAAASQGPKAMHAMNLGIVILLLPPAAIAACIARVTYRYRGSKPPETRQ